MKRLLIFCLIVFASCEKRADTLSVTLEFTDYISHLKVQDIEVCTFNPTTSPTCQQTNALGLVTFKTHPDDYIYSYDKDEQFSASHYEYFFQPIKTEITSYLDNQQIYAYPNVWIRPLGDTSDVQEITYIFRRIRGNEFFGGYKIQTGWDVSNNVLRPKDLGKSHFFEYRIKYSDGYTQVLPVDTIEINYRVYYFNHDSKGFKDTLPSLKSLDTIDFTFKTKL